MAGGTGLCPGVHLTLSKVDEGIMFHTSQKHSNISHTRYHIDISFQYAYCLTWIQIQVKFQSNWVHIESNWLDLNSIIEVKRNTISGRAPL